MPDFVIEYFYDSHAEHKWVAHVYVANEFQFVISGATWQGLLEDLQHATRINLEDQLSVTW